MKNSTAVILLLISAGLAYTFILPEYGQVTALQTEATGYQTTLSNISDLSNSRDSLLLKYKALPTDEIAKLSQILPNKVDAVTLAYNLDSIASTYGITLKSITPEGGSDNVTNAATQAAPNTTGLPAPVAAGPAYGYTDMQITFISTYQNFRLFLGDLEKSQQIVDVRSVTFLPTGNGLSQFSLGIRTYWLK